MKQKAIITFVFMIFIVLVLSSNSIQAKSVTNQIREHQNKILFSAVKDVLEKENGIISINSYISAITGIRPFPYTMDVSDDTSDEMMLTQYSQIHYLPLVLMPDVHITLASLQLIPFDANLYDINGPSSFSANYGKTPEIIVASNGLEMDVLVQNYNPVVGWNAVLLHIKPYSSGYKITQALTDIPMLDRIMGLAVDDFGNRYYATGIDEGQLVNPDYPPLNTYRSDIVRVVKLNTEGNVEWNIDLDKARHDFDTYAEMIINPMTFSTSRLAVGGDEIALVHGINTNPDWNLDGARHQKALSTRLDAISGAIIRTSSMWVSHSFDHRLFYDVEGIIEHHLGDGFPRYLVFGRDHISYPLFHIKGRFGENATGTRLGNIALIENDPIHNYIALFVTETSADVWSWPGGYIKGPRNLAIVRVKEDDNSIDPNLPDSLTVVSCDIEYTNRLKWLTNYTSSSNLHAERPKLIKLEGNQYVVLWEEWYSVEGKTDEFKGVYALLIDDQGTKLRTKTFITNKYHLHRGDDAFSLDNRAAWMTGSSTDQALYLHLVDVSLNYEIVKFE